ncbi:MAG: Fe-S oxidoreductase [Planctomycetes bacterium]|nr:Fe-S oxidoreductase [Planctomycetota bacterium]
MNILLVEPSFPYPNKSKNQAGSIHRNFVPIGLLKLGAFYMAQGSVVKLVRGNKERCDIEFEPSHIFVTSIFTYWSSYVWEAIEHYRKLYPNAEIALGGIYATLHHRKKYFKDKLAEYDVQCQTGLHKDAENCYPDYSLLDEDVEQHVTHAMRGCIRRCSFCGTWRIERKRYDKPVDELTREIVAVGKSKVLFFDNNFLAHGDIDNVLIELANVRVNSRPVSYESQSGFDGRLLQRRPRLAELIKGARFKNIRIAWDNSVAGHRAIKKQIDVLVSAGYQPGNIAIFMIYNYDMPYEKMLEKLAYCAEWGVQINDCRYRPLKAVHDNYNPRKYKKGQTKKDYYIHSKGGWTDALVRDFRRKVRQHNIWVRYAKCRGEEYNRDMERWSEIHTTFKYFGLDRPPEYEKIQTSPTWTQRVSLMKRLKNHLKKHKMLRMSLKGINRGGINQVLIEVCHSLGIQVS